MTKCLSACVTDVFMSQEEARGKLARVRKHTSAPATAADAGICQRLSVIDDVLEVHYLEELKEQKQLVWKVLRWDYLRLC